jgi:3-oxoacyl-[acyl-carrier protein] reductase/meso-butanediol dehydrogenase/(S,S)-butanediol dehydrogenase/diacetyl reductase
VSNLKGKIALVTGAATHKSMGRAIALQLATEGADVVVADKFAVPKILRAEDANWRGLHSVVQEIEALGAKGLAVEADVGSSKDVDALVAKTLEKFGKIDILVHCVGVRGPVPVPVIELDEETWRMLIDVNLHGSFLVGKAVAKAMLPNGEGKKIVFIGSGAGIEAFAGAAGYCAAKHGLMGLMKCMAIELAPHKINVNAVLPVAFDTNFRDEQMSKEAKEKGISVDEVIKNQPQGPAGAIPIGRLGTPEDAAGAVSYLVSDKSSFASGASILLAGGLAI